ncbi:MAG: ABC transporter ATP-binding protein [Elusimicrobia bacterium]|nr:ABC transporter ATP-binding protein [Elusimicrobiota bacterium]
MKTQLRLLRSFFSLLKPSIPMLARAGFLAVALMLLELGKPYLTGMLVDMAGRGEFSALFYRYVAALGALFLFAELAAVGKTLAMKGVTSKLQLSLSVKTFASLYRRPLSVSARKSPGESFYQATQDVDRVSSFMTETAAQIPYIALRVLLTIGIMLKLNPQLALLAVILLPLMLLPQHFLKKKMLDTWESLIDSAQNFYSLSEELFAGTYLVKAMGREKAALRRFCGRLTAALRMEIAGLRVSSWLGMASRLAALLGAALFIFYALFLMRQGLLSFGALAALAIYIMQLNSLAAQAAEAVPDLALGLLSCRRLEDIFSSPTETGTQPVPVRAGAVEFKSVSFAYADGKQVLNGASFSVEAGKHTVLLGPSGCGKTTVFNLLLGLYSPQSGSVEIDGAGVSGPRPNIGVAPQESYFWNDTVRNNLLFASPKAAPEELDAVLSVVGLKEFSDSLPQGMDTPLGHNAATLSRGQKQRLAIARALLTRPALLLLDEALSSLDMASERLILDAVRREYPGLAIISAAHRPQSALMADAACIFDGMGGVRSGLSPEQALSANR